MPFSVTHNTYPTHDLPIQSINTLSLKQILTTQTKNITHLPNHQIMTSYRMNLVEANKLVTILQYKHITQVNQSFTHAMKSQTHQ